MDLRERLNSLGALTGPSLAARRAGSGADALAELLPGETVQNDYGETYVLDEAAPTSVRRGQVHLSDALDLAGGTLELLAGTGAPQSVRDCLFLDTETTGLAGGTGTYAFLIGVGYFDGDRFRVRQFLLRDVTEEQAALAEVRRLAREFAGLVSFNGRSFDWPLLTTRLTLHFRREPLPKPFHVDLLTPARRIFGAKLSSCSLSALEESVLGAEREDDVPGSLVPHLYFQYLRSGDATALVPIVRHNRLDVLSMAALLGHVGRLLTDPAEAGADELELYGLARHFEKLNRWENSIRCYEAAVQRGASRGGRTREMLSSALGSAYKRVARFEQASRVWEALTQSGEARSAYPYLELAKHYEHRVRDYGRAHDMATRALELIERRESVLGHAQAARDARDARDVRHRLARLERKMERCTRA